MKALFFTFLLMLSCACLSAEAQINYALEGGAYGPQSIFGYDDPSTLSSIGNVQVGITIINDGITAAPPGTAPGPAYGYHVDNFNQPSTAYGEVGVVFSTPVAAPITEVTFNDAAFFDGGWFGVSGIGPDGKDDSDPGVFSSAALIVPTLQVTYSTNPTSSSAVWTTVLDTNNYMQAMTGSAVPTPYNTPTSTASTFTLDLPVIDITGIRLVGEVGGYDSAYNQTTQQGYGFLGAYEFATPEPSTYAMMIGGLALLGFCLRRKTEWRRS
jgi:hypothetical protein